jgi:hypothetical protein
MLAVPFYERALYELSEEEMTPDRIISLSHEIELSIQGARATRPLLSVPHILADESAAYYHGYVLAEMSVHQTRRHFLKTYGSLTDNENIGKDLTEVYWKPGNSQNFLDLVQQLTLEPLTSHAWVEKLQKPLEVALQEEKEAYERAVIAGPKYPRGASVGEALEMRILLVHGDEVIADSADNGLAAALEIYKQWISQLE